MFSDIGNVNDESVKTLEGKLYSPVNGTVAGFGTVDKLKQDHTCDDSYRIDYLKAHIQEMKKAVEIDGVDLMGYTPWGC